MFRLPQKMKVALIPPTLFLGICFILSCNSAVQGQNREEDPEEPPLVGQSPNFNGAVGAFKIATSAQPTEMQAEDPCILTVTITGIASSRYPPKRINLRQLREFNQRFYIEDLPNAEANSKTGIWEFRYRLKPLNVNVKEIPALRFEYFKPGVVPKEKGYRSAYSLPIPLKVNSRTALQPDEIPGPDTEKLIPATIVSLAEGTNAVLRHEEPLALPGIPVVVLLLLIPPALCGGWCAVWRFRHPDAARNTRLKQSRAAQRAIHALKKEVPRGSENNQAARIFVEYLNHWWDFRAEEPTPAEVSFHLHQLGCPDSLVEKSAEFFKTWDRARFAPIRFENGPNLAAEAIHLIQDLEAQAWSEHPS
jgi:hypothetical protein